MKNKKERIICIFLTALVIIILKAIISFDFFIVVSGTLILSCFVLIAIYDNIYKDEK